MPDELPQPGTPQYNAMPKWLQYTIAGMLLLQSIIAPFVAVWTKQNGGKIETIENRQGTQIENEETKIKAMRVNLWNSWKNMEWLAEQSGKQSDKDKAAEAGRIYQEFVRLHNGD